MSRVFDYFDEAGVFYMATIDNGRPKVRPLALRLFMDGKIIFAVGDFKDVYRQMLADPHVEIAATKPDFSGHWIRYTGRAVFETDEKYAAAMLEFMPEIRATYNEETGYKLMCFHLEDVTALDIDAVGNTEDLLA